jgi:hypothetical protein
MKNLGVGLWRKIEFMVGNRRWEGDVGVIIIGLRMAVRVVSGTVARNKDWAILEIINGFGVG